MDGNTCQNLSEIENISEFQNTSKILSVHHEDILYPVGFILYYYGIFCVIFIINIPGNILVICTVLRHSTLRQPCNYYLVSLAISDVCIGFVYPLYNISHLDSVPEVSQPLGDWSVCRFLVAEVLALEICSSYHLVAITINRYLAIVYPLRYHVHVTNKTTTVTITVIWIFSQGSAILIYTIYNPDKPIHICRYELIFSVAHVALLFVIQLFLPLVVMCSLYVRIARIARKQAKVMALQSIRPQSRNVQNTHVNNHELKSTIMVSILLGCFVLGWLPMIIYFFYTVTCPGCHLNHYVRASVRILLYLNSAINIFIYAGRLSDFRKYIKTDLKQCFQAVSSRFSYAKIHQRRGTDSRTSQVIFLSSMRPSRNPSLLSNGHVGTGSTTDLSDIGTLPN